MIKRFGIWMQEETWFDIKYLTWQYVGTISYIWYWGTHQMWLIT